MESGDFDAANREKYRIEEKQRTLRRERERMQKADPEHAEQYEYQPRWFSPVLDPITNKTVHVFNDKYWTAKANHDWTVCPDLYWILRILFYDSMHSWAISRNVVAL